MLLALMFLPTNPALALGGWQSIPWLGIVPPLLPPEARTRIAAEKQLLLAHKGYLENRLQQAQPLIRLIGQEVDKRRLPALLILLPVIESGYRLDVVSPKGAAGVWQLMPATATRYGVPQTTSYDGRLSLPIATHAALTYLSDLSKQFNGDWLLALAAYNCGENRVKGALQDAQQASYWQLPLPDETKRYVPRLLALAELIQSAERHGLNLPAWQEGDELVAREYTGPLWLSDLAHRGNWPLARLELLNPAFRKAWLPAGMSYTLLLPRDQAKRLDKKPPRSVKPGIDTTPIPALLPLQSLSDPLLISHVAPLYGDGEGVDLSPRAVMPNKGDVLDSGARAPVGLEARPLLLPIGKQPTTEKIRKPAGKAGHSG